tara:strand:- start:2003 stop:2320 length:318 start_codon:yes stop_codon:yes gene_type:complete
MNEYHIVDYPNDSIHPRKFNARSPGRAAKKVLTFLGNNVKNKADNKFAVFTIIKKKNQKKYKFIGTRVKLNKPVIVFFNGKKVQYNYKNIVTRYEAYYKHINKKI